MPENFITSVLVGLIMMGLSSCSPSETEGVTSPPSLDLSMMDTTVRAQDDFFTYVNGGWLKRTQVPASKGAWCAFDELKAKNQLFILELLQKASQSQSYPEGTGVRKAIDFFAMGMDSIRAEEVGMIPVSAAWTRINNLGTKNEIQNYLAEQELIGGGAFFTVYTHVNQTHSKETMAFLGTGGLGLPDRDYYIGNDPKSREIRGEYESHIEAMLLTGGVLPSGIRKEINAILNVETLLAKATLSNETVYPSRMNHRSLADLSKLMPSINWPAYFERLGVAADTINVDEPIFMRECERVFSLFPLDGLKSYLRWAALRKAAPYLNHALVKESFEFNHRYLEGAERMEPRWKRVLEKTNHVFGDAIGKLYTREKFSPKIKAEVLAIAENCRLALAGRLKELTWASDSTKAMILQKLKGMKVTVGYPEKWKSYGAYPVEKDPAKGSYHSNIVATTQFFVTQQFARIGKPLDEAEWEISPQDIVVHYQPATNEVIFPIALLQPPFYNTHADAAVNYGAIGAVIAREILRGVDDYGGQYDGEGNLRNWWTAADVKKFVELGNELASQQNRVEVFPGVFLRGNSTRGGEARDLGGLCVAYEALQRHLRETGRPGEIDGFTPEQRFFISWSTIWRTKYRDDYLRTFIRTDNHPPARYRVMGLLSNMPSFYDAFMVKPGDKMHREEGDRVQIW